MNVTDSTLEEFRQFAEQQPQSWQDDVMDYQQDMIDVLQRKFIMFGEQALAETTPEMVAKEIYRAYRSVSLEHVELACMLIWEDDLLDPNMTGRELVLSILQDQALEIATAMRIVLKCRNADDVAREMDIINPEDELVDMVCKYLGFETRDEE